MRSDYLSQHAKCYPFTLRTNTIDEPAAPSGLTISELAARTGVPQSTLRTWEARYGYPRPQRLAGGHRRYDARDVTLVEEILRSREAGLSLESAIGRAVARTAEPESSVFAALRRRRRELSPRLLTKATLLALSRAIEDECCARAEHASLFASFQDERFFAPSRARWADLARTANVVVVFADFHGGASQVAESPLKVHVPDDAPLRREWALVCDSPDYPACVSGWEHPGQGDVPDAERRFETVWSVDPRVVRDAALTCAHLAHALSPAAGPSLWESLIGVPAAVSPDLRRASGLLDRMLSYL